MPVGESAEDDRADDRTPDIPSPASPTCSEVRPSVVGSVSVLASAPTSVTSSPSMIQLVPNAATSSVWKRPQRMSSRRAGMSVLKRPVGSCVPPGTAREDRPRMGYGNASVNSVFGVQALLHHLGRAQDRARLVLRLLPLGFGNRIGDDPRARLHVEHAVLDHRGADRDRACPCRRRSPRSRRRPRRRRAAPARARR